MPVPQENSKEFGSSQGHGQPVVFATDRGKLVTVASLSPFGCAIENARALP